MAPVWAAHHQAGEEHFRELLDECKRLPGGGEPVSAMVADNLRYIQIVLPPGDRVLHAAVRRRGLQSACEAHDPPLSCTGSGMSRYLFAAGPRWRSAHVGGTHRARAGTTHHTASDARRFATLHREVVQRWGRFPHRNELLGRESTPEEGAGIAAGTIPHF